MNFIVTIIHKIQKFNILDWLIIISLCLAFSFIAFNRLSKKEQWVWIRIRIANGSSWGGGGPPPYWYAQDIMKGQFSYNTFGQQIAEVGNIENYDVGGTNRLIYADLKLKVSYDARQHIYIFNYQPLQIGNAIDLTINKFNLRGVITYIGDNKIQYTDKEIDVKLLSVFPWEADSYAVGMRMTDMLNNTVAQILSVNIVDATVAELRETSGHIVLLNLPNDTRKEVSLRLKIRTFSFAGVSYFIDGAPIKIGENIWFQFQNTSIKSAIITKIY